MEVKGYTLINLEKIDRALNGIQKADSTRMGGVGNGAYFDEDDKSWKREGAILSEEEVSALEFALLAEYDKFAGAIKRGDDKVKLGSFYNFKARKPYAEPKVVFEYRFGSKIVDVPDGIELPGEVKAKKILKEAQDEEREEVEEKKQARRIKKNK